VGVTTDGERGFWAGAGAGAGAGAEGGWFWL